MTKTNRRNTILLVEDEAIIALNETAILKKHGYDVITADSGETSIQTVSRNDIDLILMDIDLGNGKMDGTEAAETILQNHDIPVMFLTSHSEKEMVEKVKGITRYGYILKNAGEFVLIESISMAFELYEAHRRMKESKENYELIFHSINDGIIFQDLTTGSVLDVNEKALEMYGYDTKEEMIGAFVDRFSSGEQGYKNENAAEYLRKANNGTPQLFEWQAKKKNGDLFWVEVNLRTATTETEPKIIATVRDINQRKETEEKYRLLAENSHDSVIYLDRHFRIKFISESLINKSGYSSEDIESFDIFSTIHPDFREEIRTKIRTIIQNKQTVSTSLYRALFNDGSTPWIEAKTKYLYDEQNEFAGLIVNHREVTDRVEAELRLKESEAQLRELIEKLPVPLVISRGLHEDVLSLNRKFIELFGYNENDIPNARSWFDQAYPDEQYRNEVEKDWTNRLKTAMETQTESVPLTVYIVCKDGTERFVSVRVLSLGDIHIIAFLDLTESNALKRDLENSLEEKNYLLKELNHRVKNNLLMVSALIENKNSALGDAVNIFDLTRQIDAIRIIHEKLYSSNDFTNINFGEYVENLLTGLFSLCPQRVEIEQNIAVQKMHPRTALPLGLIINEIATNAIKHGFTDNGKARFTIDFSIDNTGTRYILVLSNSGKPISKDIDLDNPQTLGLELITALVQQLDGTIELQGEPHPVFTIKFPVEEEP